MSAAYPLYVRIDHLWCRVVLGLFFMLMLIGPQNAVAAEHDVIIPPGKGRFLFIDEQEGVPAKQITVYTFLAKGLKPNLAPIVFVMHGHGKNAEGYRDVWVEHAEKYQFMVVVPLFDKEQWGGGDYSYASLIAKDGTPQPKSMWSFMVIERLFDFIKRSTGNGNPQYLIYGHSEGGQFVHRLVLFLPEARFARAVAANPGWYTVPNFGVKYPYGLVRVTGYNRLAKEEPRTGVCPHARRPGHGPQRQRPPQNAGGNGPRRKPVRARTELY